MRIIFLDLCRCSMWTLNWILLWTQLEAMSRALSHQYNGVFTLPDTDTDKKMGWIELCGGVHTGWHRHGHRHQHRHRCKWVANPFCRCRCLCRCLCQCRPVRTLHKRTLLTLDLVAAAENVCSNRSTTFPYSLLSYSLCSSSRDWHRRSVSICFSSSSANNNNFQKWSQRTTKGQTFPLSSADKITSSFQVPPQDSLHFPWIFTRITKFHD